MDHDRRQTILVVDDEPINLEYLSRLLKTEYTVILAMNGQQALEFAATHLPDLIILDIMMPGMDGYEACARLKSSDVTNNIPIIFVTALDSPENEERGLNLGALDYIVKPFHPAIIQARVSNILALSRQRSLLEELVNLDALTEISNRRNYEVSLQKEWFRCMRDETPLSLVMLDIDHFKQFNDHYGHAAGDKVLKRVAQALQKVLRRPGDFVARYGGEEFVLLLPGTNAAGGIELAESILASVRRLAIPHEFSPFGKRLTISIGGATQIPLDSTNQLDLFKAADLKLYEAKSKGRNRVVWAENR